MAGFFVSEPDKAPCYLVGGWVNRHGWLSL